MKLAHCIASLAFLSFAAASDPSSTYPIYTSPVYTTPTYQTYTAPAYVPPKTTYDYDTGNSYRTSRQADGTTKVRGTNLNTGSTWDTTIKTNGDMRGTDSNGDIWTYDKSTGSYSNTNGKICTGTGASRICSDD